ncbi:isoamyl acetate-hydrolyzing esterase, partial [Coemansia sp. RSA 2399]
MNKDTMTHSSRKSYWLRCVLPVIALGLIILNLVYLTNSTDDADSTVTVKGDAYEYPMYDITLVFGDSITQLGYEPETGGWVTHLSNMYVRRMDILNRGFSGYNTTRAKDVAHTVFPVRRDYRLAHSAGGQGSVSAVAEWLLKGVRAITGMETKKDKWSSSMWPRSDPPFPKFYPKVQLCILFFGANDAADPRDDRHTPLEEYPSNLRYIINMLRDPDSANYSPGTRIVLITPPAVGEK